MEEGTADYRTGRQICCFLGENMYVLLQPAIYAERLEPLWCFPGFKRRKLW